jgi:hypothetical protein
MASVRELIFTIKERPELYIGQRSLSLLQAYLHGWLNRDEKSVTDSELIGKFQNWIQKRYNIRSSQSWAQIILFYSTSEYDGLDNFFRLFEEFMEQKKDI